MQRRHFLKTSTLAGAGAALASATLSAPAAAQQASAPKHQFKLKYAPSYGHFENHAGRDYIDQLKYAADQGFTAWEDNGMKGRDKDLQTRIGKTLADLGMTMGIFICHADFRADARAFASRNRDARERVVQDIRDSVDVAKRTGAKWMTTVCDSFDPRLEWGYQMANCIDVLRRCAEVFEPHDLVMVLEPLNWFRDHPGLFLHTPAHCYEICRGVNSPACKVLFDVYHTQIQSGNLIANIDLCWDEIAYVQTGDNPGRKEPGTGEINYRNVFKHLHARGYQGVVGMEHGKSKEGKEGEDALVAAYAAADNF